MSDQDDHDLELVIPFVIVESKGGPYQDESFVAGYQVGQIATQLEVTAAIGAPSLELPIVRRAILPQLELHAMHHGFPVLTVSEPTAAHIGGDEWCSVSFARHAKEPS